MKDYLNIILSLDDNVVEEIKNEKTKLFLIKERALVNYTLNTHKLTKEYLESNVKYLKDMLNTYLKDNSTFKNGGILLSPGYWDGKNSIEAKYNFYKLLLDNLEEGLTYRGVLNNIASDKNKRIKYTEYINKLISLYN